MKGKKIPQIGRVEISIIEESQSRWLAFERKELDYLALPATFVGEALDESNNLKPKWVEQGVSLYRAVDPSVGYTFFNFRDPLVGGFAKEKIALRRAIIMGYDLLPRSVSSRKNQEVQAQMPIPPGVVGFDPRYRSVNQYDPVLANKLLDYFGYKKGSDGYRTLPDGKPLVDPAGDRHRRDRPRVQRAVEEVDGCDRHPHAVRARQVRGHAQSRQGMPGDDVAGGVDGRLSGRRQLHAAALRPEHRREQQWLLRIQGVRRDCTRSR